MHSVTLSVETKYLCSSVVVVVAVVVVVVLVVVVVSTYLHSVGQDRVRCIRSRCQR